jgi:hypothetical protein
MRTLVRITRWLCKELQQESENESTAWENNQALL